LARKHALPSHTVALKRKKFAKAGGDVKATGLKELQGLIWQQGYESGLLKSHVYHDVPPALEGWKELGLNISIYSSGSIHAQKLFFANTEYGDLTNYFDRYYDTTSGAKIFLSNVPAELSAAIAAGLQAVLLARPGNTFADWNGAIANSFADLEIAMSVATPG
jgi:enolase-phosphatase E1